MCADKKVAPASGNAEAKSADEKVKRLHDYTREVGRVRSFFKQNPHLWDELCSKCERHIAAGVPFGVQEVLERWRWFRPVVSGGSELRINNNWSPIVARLLVAEYPEADKLVERRRSVYDSIIVEVSSHGTV